MPELPNFLIVMSDQHAPGVLGGLGHPAVRTPALDRLMAEAVTFRQAHCPYPMCTPARASFMTGLLAPQHGVWELGTPLPSDLPTWVHVLRRAGYETVLSGHMHFIGRDQWHGFERLAHPGFVTRTSPFAYADWDRPLEFDVPVNEHRLRTAGPRDEPTRNEKFDVPVVNAALKELPRLVERSDRPWLLVVGLIQPHTPYEVSRRFYEPYATAEIPLPRTPPGGKTFEEMIPPQFVGSRRWHGLTSDWATDDQVREARRCYYGMVSEVDELVGRLVARLEELDARRNTWIAYLSDHGDNLGEHGFWAKCNFYEESVRIPWIVSPPGCRHGGAMCDAPVSLIDWMPTVLELTGQKEHFDDLPGRSLLPLLENPAERWENRAIVADYACEGTRVPMRMVRQGRWKACFAPGFSPVLYDLETDPHEWHDRGTDPAVAPVLQSLEACAHADGWDGERLLNEIHRHQRRLRFLDEAERTH